ncbi:MAG: PilZ domain-containing protein [Pyrinomonadaceae bacterium]
MPPPSSDRRVSPRFDATLEARLEFSVLMVDAKARGSGVQRMMAFAGHTLNLSETGLAVFVRARNIDESYLTGGEGAMRIELDLPDGPLEIRATPVRYERIVKGKTESGYFIGAQIVKMSDRERERYIKYLRDLHKASET